MIRFFCTPSILPESNEHLQQRHAKQTIHRPTPISSHGDTLPYHPSFSPWNTRAVHNYRCCNTSPRECACPASTPSIGLDFRLPDTPLPRFSPPPRTNTPPQLVSSPYTPNPHIAVERIRQSVPLHTAGQSSTSASCCFGTDTHDDGCMDREYARMGPSPEKRGSYEAAGTANTASSETPNDSPPRILP